jgi:hypothetical protein
MKLFTVLLTSSAVTLSILGRDPSEKRNVNADHTDVLAQIQQVVNAHQSGIVPVTPQLR